MYDLVVGHWQIAPSEYWQMTPAAIQVLIESKRPKTVGGIHEDDLEMLIDRRAQLERELGEKGITVV